MIMVADCNDFKGRDRNWTFINGHLILNYKIAARHHKYLHLKAANSGHRFDLHMSKTTFYEPGTVVASVDKTSDAATHIMDEPVEIFKKFRVLGESDEVPGMAEFCFEAKLRKNNTMTADLYIAKCDFETSE